MPLPRRDPPTPPRGRAFTIDEHLTVGAWATERDMRLVLEIDRVVGGEEYEEVIALYDRRSTWRRATFWRAADAIVLEPVTGPASRFGTIRDALAMADPAAMPDGDAR